MTDSTGRISGPTTGPTTGQASAAPTTGEMRALRMTAQRLAGLIADGDTAAVREAVAAQPRLLGAAVERDGQDGWTPLHLAVAAGRRDAVELLAGAGADLQARTEHGRTPLQVALEHAPDLVPVLEGLGAPVDAATAAYTGDTARLVAQLGGGAPLIDPHSDVALLTWAAFGGHLDSVQLLVQRGADPDGGALQAAAGGGHPEVVRALLAAGADVGRHDPDTGRTPLHSAVSAGPHVGEVVALLLAAGADVEETTSDGASALDIARVSAARDRAGSAAGRTGWDTLVDQLEQHSARR